MLRHGACTGGRIFRGQIDVPLTSDGWQQMAAGLTTLRGPWHRIVSSPLQRCQQFADKLGREKNLPVVTDPGIAEMAFGEWEGQAVDKIWREQQTLCEAWGRDPENHSPPGGEPFRAFRARVLESIGNLARNYEGESLLLVTHGGVIKLLLTIANHWPPSQMMPLLVDYGFVASFDYDRDSSAFTILYPEQNAYVYRA